MKFNIALLLLLLLAAVISAYEVSYKGHTVLRCNIKENTLFEKVIKFSEENFIDLWRADAFQGQIDINLSLDQMKLFVSTFNGTNNQIECKNFIADLESAISEEAKTLPTDPGFDFVNYYSYADIVSWMNQLQANFSFLYVIQVGSSTQGTPIYGISMNGGPGIKERADIPTIYYQGGQHAREWIGPATVCFIINSLAQGYGKNGTITQIVDDIQWIFIPVVNPDGYTYSRGVDRLWRKNRRQPPSGSTCWGVDTNRNWPAFWNQGGSSTNPCTETYHGTAAGSEVEVQNIVNFFRSLKNVVVATDWHSYSQLYLIPYGWTTTNPVGYNDMMNLGNRVATAIRQIDGRVYQVGSTARILYIASGSFTDWAFQAYNVKYSQTIELRDTGQYGFILPANQIIPTGNENFNGVVLTAVSILRDK
jgi:hypothetical protein